MRRHENNERNHQAGNASNFLEHLDLLQRILPRRRIQHQHHVVRGGGVDPPQHAADLGQFVHQFALVLQPSGGVDDQHVDPRLGRLLHRVPHHARRIAAFRTGHDRHADAVGPGPQLPDRGGAERVARGQHHAVILLHEQMRELRDGRRLAAAIDADHQDHLRPRKRLDRDRRRDLLQHLLDLLGDHQPDAEFFHVALEATLGQPPADLSRGLRAQVGRDQRLLDIVERRIIQPRSAEPRKVADQPIRRTLEATKQFVVPGITHAVFRSGGPVQPSPRAG